VIQLHLDPDGADGQTEPGSFAPSDSILDPMKLWEPPPEKAEGVDIRGRVAVLLKSQLQAAVQSGLFRFKTEGDLVRTAVAWFFQREIAPRLARYGRVDESLRTLGAKLRAADEAIAVTNAAEDFVLKHRSALRRYIQWGLWEEAREYVAAQMGHMDDSELNTSLQRAMERDQVLQALLTRIEEER